MPAARAAVCPALRRQRLQQPQPTRYLRSRHFPSPFGPCEAESVTTLRSETRVISLRTAGQHGLKANKRRRVGGATQPANLTSYGFRFGGMGGSSFINVMVTRRLAAM